MQSEALSPTGNRKPHLGAFKRSLSAFAAEIKIAHTVFALPFAASALFLEPLPLPTPMQAVLLLLCMITARSYAMGVNRLVDSEIDGRNPRTAARALPSGRMQRREMGQWVVGFAVSFFGLSCLLSPLAGLGAVMVLLLLGGYPWIKRMSWLAHYYLGLCLGLAPVAVWVALESRMPPTIAVLGLAIMFWTAGFDILYALQDLMADRREGLHSVPARYGVGPSLFVSRFNFLVMVALLLWIGEKTGGGIFYFFAVGTIAVVLAVEHWMVADVSETGYSQRIGAAFFNANACVSLIFFAGLILDRTLGS